MTITTHTAIGTTIGLLVGNPILGFILGFCSHFLFDMIPHGDNWLSHRFLIERRRKLPVAYGSIDAICALLLVLFLVNTDVFNKTLIVSASIVGSVLPDFLSGIYQITNVKILESFNKLHFYFHDYFIKRWRDVKLRYSIAVQLTVLVIWLIEIR